MTEEQAPIEAAMDESEAKVQTVTVNGKTFRLSEKLTVAATYGISKAQKEEDLSGLIDATAKMVHVDDREDFIASILENEEMDMEGFSTLFGDALEKVTGRPLEQ